MLKQKKPDSKLPFWEDDFRSPQILANKKLAKSIDLFRAVNTVFLLIIGICLLLIFNSFESKVAFWICLVFILYKIMVPLIGNYYLKSRKTRVKEIQQKAYEQTNASVIGSAVHVAGHPLLGRDQPVVIALVDSRMDIYDYSNLTPLCSIEIKDIKDVKTVSYDAERIPHTEIIDSAAQALQLEISINDKQYTCLFHRMKSVRPIDWYHRIQTISLKLDG
jgi:uncharacterized membrane protein SirB2